MAERGPDLERQQSKAVLPMEEHCLHAIQELSSCMQKHNSLVMELLKEQSTRMEDLSSRMEELSSQIKELTSRTEDQPFLSSDGLSAITQLEVSVHMYIYVHLVPSYIRSWLNIGSTKLLHICLHR